MARSDATSVPLAQSVFLGRGNREILWPEFQKQTIFLVNMQTKPSHYETFQSIYRANYGVLAYMQRASSCF